MKINADGPSRTVCCVREERDVGERKNSLLMWIDVHGKVGYVTARRG